MCTFEMDCAKIQIFSSKHQTLARCPFSLPLAILNTMLPIYLVVQ
jgi:hypothetical protein